jgi:polysaccharide biosynthesis/export protein
MFTRYLATIPLIIALQAIHGQQQAADLEPVAQSIVGLVPGDTLEVFFLDFPEAAQQHLTVATDGTIFVPYAGPVKVAGLMPEQAQRAIIESLKDKQIVISPQVSLNVISARNLSVLVMGQVVSPHPVPLFAPASLAMVLNQAGGFTSTASYHVLIAHQDGTAPTEVELDRTMSNLRGMNQIVKPGDVVSVAQAGSFYALGELNRPGIFPIVGSQHLHLTEALATAGGANIYASLSKARILRTNKDGSREEIFVDLAKLHDGKVGDPLIQTDDILYVPRSDARVFLYSWLSSSINAVYAANLARNF